MNKDIKEPLSVLSTFDNHDILPVNVRQIKTPHEESKHVKSFCDYYNQNSCYNLTDSIYHLLMIDDYTMMACKQRISTVKNFNKAEAVLKSNTQSLECHRAAVAKANSTENLLMDTTSTATTTTTTINPITTDDSGIVQEHEEFDTNSTHDSYAKLDNSCDHTSSDENNKRNSPINKVTKFEFQPMDYFISTVTHYRAKEAIQIGITILQFVNILLCMLLRHSLWKDMFSSMFIMQRVSKGTSSTHDSYVKLDNSCDHTSSDENNNKCNSPIHKTTTFELQPINYFISTATHYRAEEAIQIGITILQFVNILLCMLLRYFLWKNIFSSMFIMQRVSKDQSISSCFDHLSHGAGWNKMVLWNYLLDKMILCYESIPLVKCYLYKNAYRLCSIDYSNIVSCDMQYIKELPQAFATDVKQYWLRIFSITITGLSLLLSNTLSVKNISKLLSIEDISCDYQSTFDNMTLHNDDVIPYHKSYHSHHIIFFIMWIKILTNFANDLFTTFHFGLPGAIGAIAHKKRFKDFFYIVINKTCFALEVTHWLITSHTATLLSGYKCDGQFENKHNNDKFSVMRVLNNWCRSIISTFCCNPYATNYCMNSWLTTLWNGQPTVSFYSLLYAAMYHDQVYTNRFVLSVKTLITAVFVILCWLILKWRNMFSVFPSVRTFRSIIKAKVMDFDIITHMKYNFFDIIQYFYDTVQYFYDGTYHSCLVIKRIIMSLFTVKSSCTGCDPLPHDSEASSTMCDNFVDSTLAFDLGIDDDNELAICEEATEHDQSYCILVNIPRKVPLFKTEGSDHPDAVEGVELVVNSTACVQLSNITTLHQTQNIIKHSYGGIPSCDNDSYNIVSPCECVEFMLDPHTQAEYRNADHQVLRDENDVVTGNLITCFPPYDNILDINTSHREFHQSPAEDNCIEISPSQEHTNQSDYDLDDNKNSLLENTEGSEDDDSDCDDDNNEYNGYEKYFGVAECQSFITSSCGTTEEIVWSSNSDGDNEVLLTGTYTISEAYGSDQVLLSLIDQVLCIQYTHSDAERPIGGNHVNKSKINNNQPSMLENNVNRSNIYRFNKQTVSLATSHLPSTRRTEQRRCQLITSIDDTHVARYGASRDGVYITPEGQNIIRKDAVTTGGPQIIREKLTQLQQIPTVGPQYTTSYDTKFAHEVVDYEGNGHDQNCWTQVDTEINVLHLCEPCEDDAIEDAKFVVSIISCAWFNNDHNITTSHQTSDIKCLCINDIRLNISSCSHKVVSPYECDGLTLEPHIQAEYMNADHQFSRDETDLVTGSLFSYFPPLDNVVDINISDRELHQDPAEDDSIKLLPSQEQTNQSDHDLDDNKNCLLENTEGSEDDNSDCDNDNIECNGYEKYCGVAECQSFNTSNNELVVCSTAKEIVKSLWSSNSDGDNEVLLTGTYTINEAYGSDQVVLSLIGQVLCVHTCNETSRPIGEEHVNKPKVNSNQPSVFEDNVNRSNVDQFNQQTVSLAASHFPSAARTEQRRHQPITSTNNTHVERDGPSRNDADITSEGQNIIAKDATRTEQRRQQPITSTDDTHVERDGALRDDGYITQEGQSIITNDAITTVGPQIIREKPTQSQQIPIVGPQYTTSYDTKFSGNPTMPYEEVKQRSKAKTTFLQHEVEDRSQQALKQTTVQNVHPLIPQLTNQSAASNTTTSKPKALPKRSCMVAGSTQYPLTPNLLAHPHMDHFFVKERKEIKPGHFLAKLVLQHHYLIMHNNNDDINETATAAQQSQAAAIVADSATAERDGAVTKRQHFPMNINRAGYIVFSSDLTRFTGDIKYPLPGRKATAVKIGKGGNGFVFSIFHNSKEYAVKKTVYRPNEIRVHSQLAHANLVNLEAVLIGEEHENHKGKFYAFYFMNKLDMDFRSVISTKEHGCLKHLKLQLSDQRNMWEVVMVNVKYVLRSVLKALDYMHNQGLVHRDVKASNILLKMNCQCTKPLMCACPQKYLVKLGDFDSSTTVPGHGLRIEPHQMIRYASVLPLGTMGYRAPEVSMHLVISGPYEVLYTTAVDIWSFGCLLLNILIGKCGPLKQRGEASLLLSVQSQPYSENLYNKIIKVKELQKYYSDIPELIDLVRKCLQVEVHCRPTAKQLLQLDVLQC